MNTPLQAAMRNPEPDALEFIVTHHSNLMTESDLNTIAHRAVQNGWCNVITRLSHQGFNTNLPVYHQSLLSIAVEARQPQMVETLINLGANPNEKFLKQRAKALNDEATQKILKEARAGFKKVCKAAKNGDVSAIDSILGITSCINRLNDDGKSPLHIAAKKDHVEFAQALLDKGADINFVDKKQRSALYHAVNKGNIEMIRWLLDNGADINLADKKGISPADLAQQSNDIKIQVLFSSAVDDLIEVIDTNQVSANTDNWHKPAANPDNQRTMKDKLRELRTHDKSDDDAENAMGMQSRR